MSQAPPPPPYGFHGGYPSQGGQLPPPYSGLPPPTAPGYGSQPNWNQPYGGQPYGGYQGPPSPQPGTYPDEDPDNLNYAGNPKQSQQGLGEAWDGATFNDKTIRRAFIRKVYLILTVQLTVTVGFIAFFLLHTPTKKWVRQNSWFYFVSYGVFLVTYITLVCCKTVRRRTPGNFIALSIFTLAFSYMTATIASYHDTNIVLIAAGITAGVCLAITIFAIQTKIDFTMCHGLIFALSMVLMFFGLAVLIVSLTLGPNRILNCVYAAIAALIFCVFLVYDTQQIVGGRKYDLSPEEYIYGSLQLYLDIVYIFLMLLSLFGNANNS